MMKSTQRLLILATICLNMVYITGLYGVENKILAVINGNYPIWKYDIELREKFLSVIDKENLEKVAKSNEITDILLNQIIMNYLIEQETKKYGFTLSSADIKEAVGIITKGLKINTAEVIKQAQKVGLKEKDFMAMLINEITINRFKQEYAFSRVKVSANEVEIEVNKLLSFNGKNEYHLYQITVFNVGTDDKKAETKIIDIYKLLTRDNFKNVAMTFSEDLFASKGGDLGFVAEGYLPASIKTELTKLTIGNFSHIIKVNEGYKIIFLEEARPMLQLNPGNPEHIAQLRQIAKQKIMIEKSQVVIEDYSKELYHNAAISIN